VIRSDNEFGCSNNLSRKGRIIIKCSNYQETGHNARGSKNPHKDKLSTESARGRRRPKKISEVELTEEALKNNIVQISFLLILARVLVLEVHQLHSHIFLFSTCYTNTQPSKPII